MNEQNTFSVLRKINVNENTESKKVGGKELTYLSWTWAWDTFKTQCPDAEYEIIHFDGKPYLYDPNLGYMVETQITANGETHTMWLPVMDGANKAMKDKPYTYKVKSYNYNPATRKQTWTGEYEEKTVEEATMFDINTTIMRCLVKNMAMFGLGLYIYAGEDLPDGEEEIKSSIEKVIAGMDKMTLDNVNAFYAKAIKLYDKTTPEYKQWIAVWVDKKEQLEEENIKKELESEAEALDKIDNDYEGLHDLDINY